MENRDIGISDIFYTPTQWLSKLGGLSFRWMGPWHSDAKVQTIVFISLYFDNRQ